ncbi:hypothetical protein CDO27_35100 (plasmid) [Sinorhizobium meliloti]|nr:hypothetical protein CDO27_35100 [Sinorhizobium meliloti]CCM69548.1 hypothetical protein BN406_06611 [Sinorhizobium meliloti Rm41]
MNEIYNETGPRVRGFDACGEVVLSRLLAQHSHVMSAGRQREMGQLIPRLLDASVLNEHTDIDRTYVRSDGFKFLIFQSPVTVFARPPAKTLSADRVFVGS